MVWVGFSPVGLVGCVLLCAGGHSIFQPAPRQTVDGVGVEDKILVVGGDDVRLAVNSELRLRSPHGVAVEEDEVVLAGAPALFGPALTVGGSVPGRLMYANPLRACNPLTNEAPADGPPVILVAERGTCLFSQKAVFAQQWGAAGLVLINRIGADDDEVFTMVSNPGDPGPVKIPMLMLSRAEGRRLDQHMRLGTARIEAVLTATPPSDETRGDFAVMLEGKRVSNILPWLGDDQGAESTEEIGGGNQGEAAAVGMGHQD